MNTGGNNRRWVHALWKTTNYGLFAFTGLCGILMFYGLGNWAVHFDEWKEYREQRERIAKEIVAEDEDKDFVLERVLGIPEDQTLQAKARRKEMLKMQQQTTQEQA
jgi:hypothetical protein